MKKIAFAFMASLISGSLFAAPASQDPEEAPVSQTPEATVSIPQSADEIMFGVRLPEKFEGSEESKSKLKTKVEQILGRNGAGAGGQRDVFIVEPVLTETDRSTSEGLVRNVASISGELSLTARHRYSDAVFYSAAVPLNVSVTGVDADAMLLLAQAIKPTDAAYVRFVRNARKHAFDYGAIHPEIYEVPDVAPDTVVMLVPVAIVAPAVPTAPAAPADPSAPAAPAAPVVVAAPTAPAAPQCEFTYSRPGWEMELKSCEYDKSTRMIHFVLKVICRNRNNDMNNTYTSINRAIAADGQKYEKFYVDNLHHDFPYDVPVIVQGYIQNVYSNPGTVPFIEMSFGNTKVEIRNLTVSDQ